MDTTYTDADIVYADASADENSWDNAGWTSDCLDLTLTYADIAYACVDDAGENDENRNNEVVNQNSTCIYNEPCSAERMCGDCAADEFEREQNEDAWENFKLDRKYNDTKY